MKLLQHVMWQGPHDAAPVRKTVLAAICDEMELNGRAATKAGLVVGPPRDTLSMWFNEGKKLAETAARCSPGWQPLHRRDQIYLQFYREAEAAHARWVANTLKLHRQMASGEVTIAEVTEQIDPTRTESDPDRPGRTRPVVLARTVKRRPGVPDVRALEFQLRMLARDEFAERVELTGADGEPIAVVDETEARARALLAGIDDYERGMIDATSAAQASETATDT